MAAQPAQLQHEALGLRDVVFQGITHIAPAINVVFTLPVIAAQAGATMPLSLVLSVVVCFFIANTVAQFARYVPSSGGYYTFVSRGLGARFGFLTTWSYLIYDIIGPAAAVGFLGFALSSFLQSGTGVNIPWWIFSVATAIIVWALTYFGIRLSTRTTAILGGIEMLIMLALGITFLLHPGSGSTVAAPLNPAAAPTGWGGVLGGMVFSILALSGFEAPAPLAEETKRPARFISQAIFTSLIIVGIFYIFMAYASAIGWGTGNMAAFAANANPYYALAQKLWGVGWWLIFFAIINSTLAVGIACTNAATRVMYTMAQAGTLPAALGRIHPAHKTPFVAVHVEQIFQIVSFLLVGIFFGASVIFGFLGTIATLAVIVLYILANIALTAFIRREHPADYNIWRHAIVPIVGTLLLLPVMFVTVYPVPAYPLNLTPYIFVVMMIAGFVVMMVLIVRRPEALAQGSSMLISTVQEEVEEPQAG
ncbi:MAG TPA: APC family permease [Ktedonobacteraceae bacterium]|nr:APC family permease [Ktedonobacteraceae bacterium]